MAEETKAPAATEPEPVVDAVYDFQPADEKKPAKSDEKPAAEAKPEDKPEKKPEPAAPKHNEFLVEQAIEFGATQAQIDRVSPAELKAWVKQQIAERRSQADGRKPEPDADDDLGVEVDGKKVKASDYDPGIAAVLKALKKQGDLQKQQLESIQADHARRHASDQKAAAEAFFADLSDLYGKGQYEELDPDTLGRRNLLVYAAGVVKTDSPVEIAKKLKTAHAQLQKLYGGKAEVPAPKAPEKELPDRDPDTGQFRRTPEADAEVERWRRGGVHEPTSRTTPAPKEPNLGPEERAERVVAQKFQEFGLRPNGFK